MGACDRAITVKMPGGTIGIVIDEDFAIRMSGPATRVGVYFMDHAVPTQTLPEGA
jgi:diaminopimelate epimerase